MTETRTITIPHIGRVEGHGGISVHLVGDELSHVDMDIHEGSRYYEALLKGKHFLEVQGIITRVCAICSADHTVAALEAIEDALKIQPSLRTRRLRGLMLRGAAVESHSLHVFALALPDYLGYESVMAMSMDYPSEVASALRLKQLGNRVQALVGGRAIHPVSALVGGFASVPTRREIENLRNDLVGGLEAAMGFLDLAASLGDPPWPERPMVYVALEPNDGEYGFRGAVVATSDGQKTPADAYRSVAREFTVEHSHAKHAALATGDTYMVGSLARLKLWGDRLRGRARQAFEVLFPDGVRDRVLDNNRAQLVEIVFSLESAVEICGELLQMDEVASDTLDYEVRAGVGIAGVEAPRGTLYHEFELNEDGRVDAANVVTPTAQNLADAELDLRHAAQHLLNAGAIDDVVLGRSLEMIVRAYDPCISCSVHVVRRDG